MILKSTILSVAIFAVNTTGCDAGTVVWRDWSPGVFEEAKAQNRFVILDLEAIWCHWCHMMAQTTYQDPKVVSLLRQRYLAVRADQDQNPDLSARYGNWGWPATIILAPNGAELVKRRGYFPPEAMASLLQAVIDDPTPGPSVFAETQLVPSATSLILPRTLTEAKRRVNEAYDVTNGGWGQGHKFIDTDSMDWALRNAERGDQQAKREARQTLDRATALIDPVWGGIYQYSDTDDWRSPHFEKIMWYQSNALRQYAFASALFKSPEYAQAARAIYSYMTSKLLAPSGAFYSSQDADIDATLPGNEFYKLSEAQRRQVGREPHIDNHIYSRENGWAISALVAFSDFTGDVAALAAAERAADWIVIHRSGPDGLFRHDERDPGGPFLSDTLAMGNAVLDLYAATGNRRWLAVAQEIQTQLKRFRDPNGGFLTALQASSDSTLGPLAKPYKSADEQVGVARLLLRLWRYLGSGKDIVENATSYLNAEGFLDQGEVSAGLLLASDEYVFQPTHITIVGRKDDPSSLGLHDAGRRYPASNKRLDWWDRQEGPLLNADITYPEMAVPAAFACGDHLCSLPVYSPHGLPAAIERMAPRESRAAQ